MWRLPPGPECPNFLGMDEEEPDNHETGLTEGAALIRRLAQSLPDTPGVYRMIGPKSDVLYVGKARALKKRVMSHTKPAQLAVRIQRMVALTRQMEFVHTHTEAEALLLEANLIKKLKPRFNVLMRDDKSFPYILITGDHDFPLLTKHRGARGRTGDYYGPFASGAAVNETLTTLQKIFRLRNCADSFFAARRRPCLQYHIKRCTAPCVGLVSREDYARQVGDAKAFLCGRSSQLQKKFAEEMQAASARMDYEGAAVWRDRIRALTAIQARQDINVGAVGDADVIGFCRQEGKSCVQVFFFRGGQNFGNRAYFPRHGTEDADADILSAFLAQFYASRPVPPQIIVSLTPHDQALLEDAFSIKEGAPPGGVSIVRPLRGQKRQLTDFADTNARAALARESEKMLEEALVLEKLAAQFDLEQTPARIEVYDNSHTGGTEMVGAMIVAGPEGLRKAAYRKFNIKTAGGADDYGMMREVISRRFARLTKAEDKESADKQGSEAAEWPDLLLIDGGNGQLGAVYDVLDEMGISDRFAVIAIAKGPDRHAGRETFFMRGRPSMELPPDDPVLHYLQRLRDEAHRFALGAHRARRGKQMERSALDGVPGIGARRKRALLHHFGSAQDVARAGLKDLERVEGISKAVARRIYDHFHEG